jgi:hypothetical protein
MKASHTGIIWKSVVVLALSTVTFIVATNWQWYRSPDYIEFHLLADTPHGSSESEVIDHLRTIGAKYKEPWRGSVEPNTGYPPTAVAGSSFISALVAEYTIVFTTSVEVFYIFDSNRLLVEIAVRKSTDAL